MGTTLIIIKTVFIILIIINFIILISALGLPNEWKYKGNDKDRLDNDLK